MRHPMSATRATLTSLFPILVALTWWAPAWAQPVKITPLGSHAGELCANDRALLFEDPTGVRILYDVGRTVAGNDPRLGDVHVVLLSHAHGDHIGDLKPPGPNAGTCDQPQTVSAAPHSVTAEIAAAKNSAVIVSNDMGAFLARKIQNIRGGTETPTCPAVGLGREATVPRSAPCVGNLQLGGKRTVKDFGHDAGVVIALVMADHSNNVPRSLLADAARTGLAPDGLSGYVGHANGYVVTFTNGLRVYLSGDTAVMGDMKTIIGGFYRANLAVMNMGAFAMQSEEAAFAVNELIQPSAVIPSHVNEGATKGGQVIAGTKTKQFIDLVKARPVHLPLSGRTMQFDGNAKCLAGC
jgi:L-ascorbate metabolism protein UlaG (beta-lactamase superfamily)